MTKQLSQKTFKVAWGLNQLQHLGTDIVSAKSERVAKRQVLKSLEDRFFQHHGMRILYIFEVDPKTNKEISWIDSSVK